MHDVQTILSNVCGVSLSVTDAPNDPGLASLSAAACAVYVACRVLGVIQCSLRQMHLQIQYVTYIALLYKLSRGADKFMKKHQ